MAYEYKRIAMPDVRVGDRVIGIDGQSLFEIIKRNGLCLKEIAERLGFSTKDYCLQHNNAQMLRVLRRGVIGETEYKKLVELFGYPYGAFTECQSYASQSICEWDLYTKMVNDLNEKTGTTSLERLENLKKQTQLQIDIDALEPKKVTKVYEIIKPRKDNKIKITDGMKNTLLALANNTARECIITTA